MKEASDASSLRNRPLHPNTVVFGEVGLAGEVRPVTGAHRRLSEAARLGFRYAVVPKGVLGAGPVPPEVQVVEVGTVLEAVQALAAP